MGVKNVFRGFALKVLDLDDTKLPKEQFDLIRDCSQRMPRYDNISVEDLNELVRVLKKKHYVNSIVVTNGNGSTLASSNAGKPLSKTVEKTALFNYINSEIPKSEAVLIKSRYWHVLFSYKGKVFIVNSASDLTHAEMKAIAREVQDFMENNNKVL